MDISASDRRPDRAGDPADAGPLMYGPLARWWHLLSPPEDYAEEAAFYLDRLLEASEAEEPPSTLLELGSGLGDDPDFLTAEADRGLGVQDLHGDGGASRRAYRAR